MGRTPTRRFQVFDSKTGELVVEGTSRECGEALGARDNAIYNAYFCSPDGIYRNYIVEEMPGSDSDADAVAIAKWDRFVTPLRKKYGVSVYGYEKKKGETK